MQEVRNIQLIDLSQFNPDLLPTTAEASVAAFNKKIKDTNDPNVISMYNEALQELFVSVTKKSNFEKHFTTFKESAELLGLYKFLRKRRLEEESAPKSENEIVRNRILIAIKESEHEVADLTKKIAKLQGQLEDHAMKAERLRLVLCQYDKDPKVDLVELLIQH